MKQVLLSLLILAYGCASKQESEEQKIESFAKSFYLKKESRMHTLKISDKLKKRVDEWIGVFSGDFKGTFAQYLNNGQPYKKMIQGILEEHGVPKELYFLPVIESGYVMKATSHMGAVGPWQFIRATGRRYGLVVNSYVDERRNIYKATQAAAAHLRDLYNIFGTWELALASYNAGINRITGLIIKGSNREFSKLVELGILPDETEDYIPKFIAAAMIGSAPEKYGFTIDKTPNFLAEHESVQVPAGISLRKLASVTGTRYKDLYYLNLEYKRGWVPRYGNTAEIFIPKKWSKNFKENSKKIASLASRKSRRVAKARTSRYRVRRGDTLSEIADKHGMGLSQLARLNGISRRARIYVGQKLKVEGEFSGIYTVRRGDNLTSIANRFRIGVREIKDINGLRNSRIYPGQKLRVSAGSEDTYVVQAGDTLWEIARENQMSLRQILKLNSLSSTKIRPGQELRI